MWHDKLEADESEGQMDKPLVTQLPLHILLEHEGQWVAWDAETGEYLGAADTFDSLGKIIEPLYKDRLIGFERVIPRDAVIMGGFSG